MSLDAYHRGSVDPWRVQTFLGVVGAAAGNNWHTWTKPRGISSVGFFVVGPGGGGGGGFSRGAGTAGSGGGGGAGGGIVRMTMPAMLCPDRLYVTGGAGGLGGAAGAAGSNAVRAAVAIERPTDGTTGLLLIASGNTSARGGAAGVVGAPGAAAAGETIVTQANVRYMALGNWVAQAGQAGAQGGAQTGANGGAITIAGPNGGGSGGAGCTTTNFAGGVITFATGAPLRTTVGGTAGGGAGPDGALIWAPFASCPGTGGGSNNSGVAGAGGAGAIGSGGGGGGVGTTGGRGGNGGPGLVIIYCW